MMSYWVRTEISSCAFEELRPLRVTIGQSNICNADSRPSHAYCIAKSGKTFSSRRAAKRRAKGRCHTQSQ